MFLLEHISSKLWENCKGLESRPERGGIGSVIELAMAKQVYKMLIILQLDYLEACKNFNSFNLKASPKITLVYFFLVTRPIFRCCFWGFVVPLFCSLMPNVKVLSFWSDIIKRLLGETHVFGRIFIFELFCNHGALNLRMQVLGLPASVSMARPAKISRKLSIYGMDLRVRIFRQL